MAQMGSWLTDGDVQRLVVVVTGIDSGETLERWQFNVCVDDDSGGVDVLTAGNNDENVSSNITKRKGNNCDKRHTKVSKTVKEVHDEIQAIIRQITASVSGSDNSAMFQLSTAVFIYTLNILLTSS
jgi:mitotic spindle assembly checkpoint protein MAD2